MQGIGLSRKQAEWLLAAVILARSTSFVMTKIALRDMGVFSLLGWRFLIAFLFLLPFGWKRLRGLSGKTLLKGMALGLAFFSILAAEVLGLKTTDASTASFLENTAIVFVPLFEALLRHKRPHLTALVSALLSLCGVALLTLKQGAFYLSIGELLCLLAALLYACAIILTDRFSKQEDPMTLGILQVGFMGAYSMATAFLFETPRPASSPSSWAIILILAIICSGFGFTLQPLAQSRTSAERAGLFCALSPLGTAITGGILLGETLSLTGMLGMGLILLGMVFSNLYEQVRKKLEWGRSLQEEESGPAA